MNIAYYPIESKDNKYVEISQRVLCNAGCKIYDYNYVFKKIFFIKNYDAVILNWYDTIYGTHMLRDLRKMILKNEFKIKLLRGLRVKIVFTYHNRCPHNTDKNRELILKKYAKWICKHSDYIIILSKTSKEYLKMYLKDSEIQQKVRYIPHPNYIGVYSPEIQENIYPESEQFKILFVGQVSRYKNINLILDVAEQFKNQPICFHIAGNCSDVDYKNEIKERASSLPNVELDLRFVADDELEQLIRRYHILLLPYDIKSSMNSGTVMLAFSNGRTVICPEICTVQDFDLADIYSYRYESEDDHRNKLIQQVSDAYADWKNRREGFEEKGTRLFRAVKENNSPDKLKEYYENLLKEIEH